MKTHLTLRWLAALSLLIFPLGAWSQETAPKLKAGAATSNITPEIGINIVGGFVPAPSTHIHDELHARCLVLDDGQTKLAFVVCDLLGLHRSVSVEARRLIQEATGIPAANVLISGTHTHSAATALGVNRYTSEQPLDDYQKFVASRIRDGVRRALNTLRPAQIGYGTVDIPEHLNNRRWFLQEGTMPVNPFGKIDEVKMNPGGTGQVLLEPAGPIDPTVHFIAVREPSGAPISVFAAYSLHYVGGVGPGHISADYFGMFSETLKKLLKAEESDPAFVAMLANGTSGDINNINFKNRRPSKPPYGQMRYVAEDVANKVKAALDGVTWKDEAKLDVRFREPALKWRTIEPELLTWAKEKEASTQAIEGARDLPLIYAGRVQRLAKAEGDALTPLQVFRIGDICLGTTPCETFAEIGLEFKKRSPFPNSFMVELNHAYMGYLPTPRHFELGGYETWPGTNYLEPQASVKIMDQLIEMATEVAPK